MPVAVLEKPRTEETPFQEEYFRTEARNGRPFKPCLMSMIFGHIYVRPKDDSEGALLWITNNIVKPKIELPDESNAVHVVWEIADDLLRLAERAQAFDPGIAFDIFDQVGPETIRLREKPRR